MSGAGGLQWLNMAKYGLILMEDTINIFQASDHFACIKYIQIPKAMYYRCFLSQRGTFPINDLIVVPQCIQWLLNVSDKLWRYELEVFWLFR